MSDFEKALPFILRFEGGKVDHPADKGGRTNRGIRQVTYNTWREDNGLPVRDVWLIEEAEVAAVYRTLYWWPAKGLAWPLSLVAFDCSVLFGPGRAAGWVAAVTWHGAPPEAQAWAILCLRRERHREVVAKDKSQNVFLAGWMNRLEGLAREVCGTSGKQGGDDVAQPAFGQ